MSAADYRLSRWERYGPWIIVGVFLLLGGIVTAWVLNKAIDNSRAWKAYVAANDCRVVGTQQGDISVGVSFVPMGTGTNASFGLMPTITPEPDRQVWQCTRPDGAILIHIR